MENVAKILGDIASKVDHETNDNSLVRKDAQACISVCQKEIESLQENFTGLKDLLQNPYASSDALSKFVSTISLRVQEIAKLSVQTNSIVLLAVDNPEAKNLIKMCNIVRN
jgi:hypothetical protein